MSLYTSLRLPPRPKKLLNNEEPKGLVEAKLSRED
jgi:hypothetical protein